MNGWTDGTASRALCRAGLITMTYRNHRGEVSRRMVVPEGVWFGATEWHLEPQWFLRAFAPAKNAYRDFAMRDMTEVTDVPT